MVRFLLIALLWLVPLWAQAATIVAELDRNPVALGDPVIIRFNASGVTSGEPDFSPLQKDFEIRGRSQSTSFNFTNGVSNANTTWELTLYPLNTGNLHIPSIAFGSDQSQPLDLQVLDQPQAGQGGSADILIELESEPKQPYVQQQTIITQRLLHISPLQPQATLSHPPIEAGKGDLRQIGNTRNYTTMRNGRNYQVIERRYALAPQQSGDLTLGRTVFEGILAEPGPNTFDPFGISGKRIRRFSEPLTLQVQGRPASYTGKYWLPAKSVTLNAHWQTPPDKLKAGEPVTLTLAIVADGLAAEQLPKLDVQVPDGIKAYTDQPELRNENGADGVVGVRQEKWVIVAPYNGSYELPEIKLDWWNTGANKQETVTVGPVKMQVSGGQAAPAGQLPPATIQQPAQPETEKQQATAPTATGQGGFLDGLLSWFTWERAIFSLLLVGVLTWLAWLLWRWSRKPAEQQTSRKPSVSASKPVADAKSVMRRLEQACQQNQAQAAHDALVDWTGSVLGLRPALIATLREKADPALQVEIDKLLSSLYGRGAGNWQGAGLWKAVQAFRLDGGKAQSDSGLAELYPD